MEEGEAAWWFAWGESGSGVGGRSSWCCGCVAGMVLVSEGVGEFGTVLLQEIGELLLAVAVVSC